MKAFNIFQWYQSAGDRRCSSIKFAFKIGVFAHELWNCEWTQCPDQRWWLSNGSLLPRSESIHHHQNLLPTGSRLGVFFGKEQNIFDRSGVQKNSKKKQWAASKVHLVANDSQRCQSYFHLAKLVHLMDRDASWCKSSISFFWDFLSWKG